MLNENKEGGILFCLLLQVSIITRAINKEKWTASIVGIIFSFETRYLILVAQVLRILFHRGGERKESEKRKDDMKLSVLSARWRHEIEGQHFLAVYLR